MLPQASRIFTGLLTLIITIVKAGGKRIVSKGRPQEQDADAYDEKYLEQLPET